MIVNPTISWPTSWWGAGRSFAYRSLHGRQQKHRARGALRSTWQLHRWGARRLRLPQVDATKTWWPKRRPQGGRAVVEVPHGPKGEWKRGCTFWWWCLRHIDSIWFSGGLGCLGHFEGSMCQSHPKPGAKVLVPSIGSLGSWWPMASRCFQLPQTPDAPGAVCWCRPGRFQGPYSVCRCVPSLSW